MPKTYSVDQLKTWNKCQKRYELHYVRKLNWPSNPRNFRLGKGVHQLLDYAARNLPLSDLLTGVDADIIAVWQTLQASRWAQYPVLASEWGFSLEVEGHWIYGRIDRIVQDNNHVYILDWKTGTGIPLMPDEDWQTLIYLYAVYGAQRDLRLNITPEQLTFTYVQVKGQAIQERHIAYSQAMHEKTALRLSQTLHLLDTTKDYALPNPCPDRFCAYRKVCGIDAL